MAKKSVSRIRYADEEEVGGGHEPLRDRQRQRRLSRSSSNGSLSIHTMNRVIQPETALPISYRTLSIEVDEDLRGKKNAIKRFKEKGGVGECDQSWLYILRVFLQSSLYSDRSRRLRLAYNYCGRTLSSSLR